MSSGVRFSIVAPSDPLIDGHPSVQLRGFREPRHGAIVRVSNRHEPSWLGHPSHLHERSDRVAEVLEDLMGMHHVEGVVGEVEAVHRTHLELDVVGSSFSGRCSRRLENVLHRFDRCHVRNAARQITGDRGRSTSNVE